MARDWLELLTKEAVAEAGAEEEARALVEDSELWVLVKLGSMGSETSPQLDEEGTSMGKQEVEARRVEPPRLAVKGRLGGLQGTRGGRELPVEDTDTVLKSKRSVTDNDSSPGLWKKGEVWEWRKNMKGKERSQDKIWSFYMTMHESGRKV